MSVGEIAAALRRDADALARLLLPNGKYETPSEYRCRASLSPVGEPISVHVGPGPKQGVCGFWNNARRGGDMLDLIEVVMGLDRRGAIEWAKDYLGVRDDKPAAQSQRSSKAANDQDDRNAERVAIAQSIWRSSGPLFGPALAYLKSRGLGTGALYAGDELRCHHGLPHPSGGVFPAIVARVSDERGKGCGVWRIFLKPDGSGKAPVENPKLGLGTVAGGAVRFGGVWTHIGVTEGIETALACRDLCSAHPFPIWAALSTSGMRGLVLPDGVQMVSIFADNDPPTIRNGQLKPSPGISAAQELHDRVVEMGLACEIARPPSGKDWLDVLNAEQRAAA